MCGKQQPRVVLCSLASWHVQIQDQVVNSRNSCELSNLVWTLDVEFSVLTIFVLNHPIRPCNQANRLPTIHFRCFSFINSLSFLEMCKCEHSRFSEFVNGRLSSSFVRIIGNMHAVLCRKSVGKASSHVQNEIARLYFSSQTSLCLQLVFTCSRGF